MIKNKITLLLFVVFTFSLFADDSTPFYHQFYMASKDGSEIKLSDGSEFKVQIWSRKVPLDWKKMDRITVKNRFGGYDYIITNVENDTELWASLKQFPKKNESILSISTCDQEEDNISKLYLNSGLVFVGPDASTFERWGETNNNPYMAKAWESDDLIWILHSEHGDTYDIWNLTNYKRVSNTRLVASSEVEEDDLEDDEEESEDSEEIDPTIFLKDILIHLEDHLNDKIIQQPEAINSLVMALYNYAAGLKSKEQPVGVFLFLGPTGVGKTELAKALNAELYKDPSNLIRFDMSHFSQESNVTRLIGSPPGYINHEQGGQLTNPLKRAPKSIVLLDEIEKAHDKIRKVFLPIFDEGVVHDADNNAVNCTKAIFIMTSNLAGPEIAELYRMGYNSDEIIEIIEPKLIETLSPELYARAVPIPFHPLQQESMVKLVDVMMERLNKQMLKTKNIEVKLDNTATNYLAENGFSPKLGARPLKRLIEKKVLNLLAIAIVHMEIVSGDSVMIYYSDTEDKFYFQHL